MGKMFKPVHPGRIIRDDYLEPLEMTVVKLATALGTSRQTLTAILNERAGVTPEMAIRLSEAFDTTADLWITMQRNYDLFIAKQHFSAKGKVERVYSATSI
jgi:addiction module HigA family antidote